MSAFFRNVVINEIHFNPTGGADEQFIEFYNTRESESLDLEGFTLLAQQVMWSPSSNWLCEIECSVIRADWVTDESELMTRAGFVEHE